MWSWKVSRDYWSVHDKSLCASQTIRSSGQHWKTLRHVAELLADLDTTIGELRQLVLAPSTEKTREVLKNVGIETPQPAEVAGGNTTGGKQLGKKPGHGRDGVDAYQSAARVEVAHEKLKVGDLCPECWKGKE
jgi:hypothetical protein